MDSSMLTIALFELV